MGKIFPYWWIVNNQGYKTKTIDFESTNAVDP
jgi:hypothetical protein